MTNKGRSVEEIKAEIDFVLDNDVHRQCDYAVYLDMKELLGELSQAERQKREEVVEAQRVPQPPEFMTAREARGYNQAIDDITTTLKAEVNKDNK